MEDKSRQAGPEEKELNGRQSERKRPVYICDRCGTGMIESICKITCPNCGSRFDCSDLDIYFD